MGYSKRIKREEGAQLFRIRWYNNNNNVLFYLELKTHHESWINNSSIKERVAILIEDIPKILDFQDESWNDNLALDIVQRANPNEDQQSINDLVKFLNKIKSLIVKYKLTPCVRTKYTRIALQSSSTNNQCRVTIDKDVMIINERSASSGSSSSWYRLL